MSTANMSLVYRSDDGTIYYQPWQDLTSVGTLIDPETGDDLELIGWDAGL